MKQVDQLEGFIAQAVPKVPELTLVETNEKETIPKENPCQPTPDKGEQGATAGIQGTTPDNKA